MRYLVSGAVSVLLAAVVAVAAGCGGGKAGKDDAYGRAIPADIAVTTAAAIHADPAAFEGQEVLVAGRITSECPSGGWVWINDGTGDIYVDMHPTNVFIPQRVGRNVRALGRVVVESGRARVVGEGLAF